MLTLELVADYASARHACVGIPRNIADYGDRLMPQNYHVEQTELDLQKSFGPGFAEQVVELETGLWHGPFRSGYGTHLVFVTDIALKRGGTVSDAASPGS